MEEVGGEGLHDFVLVRSPEILDRTFTEGLLHPDAADGQGDPVAFAADGEAPHGFLETLGEAHLRSDVVLRRFDEEGDPPLVGFFSGPQGTWIVEARGEVEGRLVGSPVTVSAARERILEIVAEARSAADE